MEYVLLVHSTDVQYTFHAVHFLGITLQDAFEELVQLLLVQGALHLDAHSSNGRVVRVVIFVCVKERRVELQSSVQRKCFEVAQVIHGQRPVQVKQVEGHDFRKRVYLLELPHDAINFRLRTKVRFRQEEPIRKGNLLRRLVDAGLFALGLQLRNKVLRVADPEDGIQSVILLHETVQKECRCDGGRVSEPCGFDQHSVQGTAAGLNILQHLLHAFDKITAQGATNATIVHLHDRLGCSLSLLDQSGVDTHLPELVLNHSDSLAMLFKQDAVEQRRLSAPQKTSDDSHRHFGVFTLPSLLVILNLALLHPRICGFQAIKNILRPIPALSKQLLCGVKLCKGAPRRVHIKEHFRPHDVTQRALVGFDAPALTGAVDHEGAGAEPPRLAKFLLLHHLLCRVQEREELIARHRDWRRQLRGQRLLLLHQAQEVAHFRVAGHRCRSAPQILARSHRLWP
mmetsp:Transcript_544/g.1712  ORF Transcript_544/g.1712 Transcript_544/m.1712 type:complete len:455 (+) Transcript_544:635-1999(+)